MEKINFPQKIREKKDVIIIFGWSTWTIIPILEFVATVAIAWIVCWVLGKITFGR